MLRKKVKTLRLKVKILTFYLMLMTLNLKIGFYTNENFCVTKGELLIWIRYRSSCIFINRHWKHFLINNIVLEKGFVVFCPLVFLRVLYSDTWRIEIIHKMFHPRGLTSPQRQFVFVGLLLLSVQQLRLSGLLLLLINFLCSYQSCDVDSL